MYLAITNQGTVSRKFYELIGASNKRERMDDPTVIGNKGSGAKLAVVPLLRLGLTVAVSSSDPNGEYVLRYSTERIDLGSREADQIIFDYGEGNRFPSQLTLDAFRDWDRPIGDDGVKIFKALREYIANAWDEDKNFTATFVNDITQTVPGTTTAYLSATDEVRHVLAHLARYFKFLTDEEPLLTGMRGSVYRKSEPAMTRLFSQGVLIDAKDGGWNTSLFDYSLDSKYLLSEERVIRDWSEYQVALGHLWLSVTSENLITSLMLAAFKLGGDDESARMELNAIASIKSPNPVRPGLWRSVWENIFGEKALIGVGSVQTDQTVRDMGRTVVDNVPSELCRLLQACGISTSSDVRPKAPKPEEKPDWERIELTPEQQTRFDQAYTIFRRYYADWNWPVYFFRGLSLRWEDTRGHCGNGDRQYKEIWIAEPSLVSVEMILTVLVHEGRHCHTEANDYDRRFTQDADRQLVDILMANPKPSQVNIWQAHVSANGISVPKRFYGQPVHVLITNTELRLRIGEGLSASILTCQLTNPVTGQVSQQRKVGTFRRFGHVPVPSEALKQLPKTLAFKFA